MFGLAPLPASYYNRSLNFFPYLSSASAISAYVAYGVFCLIMFVSLIAPLIVDSEMIDPNQI